MSTENDSSATISERNFNIYDNNEGEYIVHGRLEYLSKETSSVPDSSESDNFIYSDVIRPKSTQDTKNELFDLHLNPVVFKKFQLLLSILKEVQDNMQEMDALIHNHQLDAETKKALDSGEISHGFAIDNPSMDHLANTVESSKTDEAKLNEILSLLHRITSTLSSFEQSPLLAEVNDSIRRETDCEAKSTDSLKCSGMGSKGCQPPHPFLQEEQGPQNLSEGNGRSNAELQLQDPSSEGQLEQQVHRFSKETKSLRGEIESAIRRKIALDEKLNSLIVERQRQKDDLNSSPDSENEKEDSESSFKFDSLSNLNKEERDNGCSQKDGHLSNPENPVGEVDLEDLRNDEIEIPGLAESGLSSEINSLSITINEILKENEQLHSLCTNKETPNKSPSCRKKILLRDDGGETKGAKPKRHSSQSSSSYSETDKSESSSSLNFKIAFERKIREMLKEQTDMIALLHRDKKTSYEKCQCLEKQVADLIGINRKNRMKYKEEIYAIDAENCRLEDECLQLKRLNQRLNKESRNHEQNLSTQNYKHANSCSCLDLCTNHVLCLEYFQRLLKERESPLKDAKQSDNWQKKCSSMKNRSLSDSLQQDIVLDNDVAASQMNYQEKFSSLPVQVNLEGRSPPGVPVVSDQIPGVQSLVKEVDVLRSRIGLLEARSSEEKFPNRSESCVHQAGTSFATEKDVAAPELLSSQAMGEDKQTNDPVRSDESQRERELLELREKVRVLSNEKVEMAKRTEELLALLRELASLFKSSKEDLVKTKKENNELLEKLKFRSEEQRVESSVPTTETSLRLLEQNERLQEKCNELQSEVMKALKEAHSCSLEKNEVVMEKEKLNHLLTSSLADIEEENGRLKSALKELESRCKKQQKSEELKPWRPNVDSFTKRAKGKEMEYGTSGSFSEDVEEREMQEMKNTYREGEGGDDESTKKNSLKQEEANTIWQQSLLWLQRCFVEEKLHSQLLQAAERENSARVAVLQQRVKEKGEKYHDLMTKYKKLQLILLAKKSEKKANKKMLKECQAKVEQFNHTTTAIEDNYKVMLSSLGKNIGIAVEIFSSHLYFSPSQIHPSPELSTDPAFWFAAQCSRLRWLQAQLRKLCLRSWKLPEPRERQNSYKWKDKQCSSNETQEVSELEQAYEKSNISKEESPSSSPEELKRKSKDESSHDSDYLISDTSNAPSIFASLNDAEVNLTNQQVQLAKSKNEQFSDLVGILKHKSVDTSRCFSRRSSIASDMTSPKILGCVDEEILSTDTSLSENVSCKVPSDIN